MSVSQLLQFDMADMRNDVPCTVLTVILIRPRLERKPLRLHPLLKIGFHGLNSYCDERPFFHLMQHLAICSNSFLPGSVIGLATLPILKCHRSNPGPLASRIIRSIDRTFSMCAFNHNSPSILLSMSLFPVRRQLHKVARVAD